MNNTSYSVKRKIGVTIQESCMDGFNGVHTKSSPLSPIARQECSSHTILSPIFNNQQNQKEVKQND